MPAKAGIQGPRDGAAAPDSRLRGNDNREIANDGNKPRGDPAMKLVLFQATADAEPTPGLLTERGVVDISGAVAKSYTPQLTMQGIIDDFDRLRPALDRLASDGKAIAADKVQLKA